MKNIYAHSIKSLIALIFIVFFGITSLAQNTSPLYVVEFNKIQNGIMDEGKLQKNQLTDYDDNPVCLLKVKSQGFDEATLQKIVFVPRNIMIMHKAYENGEYRLYVSSKKPGSILIKYQGEYEFKLPYNLEPKKIYELVLGMETATLNIITTPDNATIYIDDEEIGVGYGSKAVSIGAEHRYKVECENYITEENVVVFTEKEKKEIAVELRPNFGYVTVKTTPSGADVYVDDKLVGKTPYLSEVIKRGMHKITVNKEGYETSVQRVNIDLNEEQTVEFELVEGESSMPVQQGSGLAVVAADKEHDDAGGKLPEKTETQKVYTMEDIEDDNIIIEDVIKEGDKYVIEYSLGESASAIGLFYSEDNGVTWKQTKYIEGDFYKVWPSKKKRITWNYTKETDLGQTPAFKLKIMQKGSIDKTYMKDLEKRGFAERNPTAYYYDNGKLLRKFHGGWFVQPEIGLGTEFDSYRIMNINCLVGYQIARPLGIGLKTGFNFYNEGNMISIPLTLNLRGFLGENKTCMYYNVGLGYMAKIRQTHDHDYEFYIQGFSFSAEIGLAVKNFNIGVEYSNVGYHRDLDDNYGGEKSQERINIFMLKLGYNIPLKKK